MKRYSVEAVTEAAVRYFYIQDCETMEMEWDGKPCAIDMVSAPLSISIFSYTPYTKEEKAEIEKKRAEERRRAKEAEERHAGFT